MIPIRDTIPCLCRPVVTWALMFVNSVIFLVMQFMPEQMRHTLLYLYGMVAARYTHPDWAQKAGFPDDDYLSFFTSMFLHGGWVHVIMNVWFLWIFADNIEDKMGRGRFLIFYIICGLLASYLQYYFNPDAMVPVIGASGAIAGVMGAYFFLFPYARIILLVPLFIVPLFFEVPAIAFLGVWVVIQMHSATESIINDQSLADVAWWGHMGGFFAGVVLYPVFLRNDDTN